MITEIERASGGRTEIGDFGFDWKTLTAEVTPFVLHGTEPATEAPAVSRRIGEGRTENHFDDEARYRYRISVVDEPQVNILVDAEGQDELPRTED